jgi:sugar/nucleoside kinase (ribokinase family)
MANNRGTFGKIKKDGEDLNVVYVIWHTSDPIKRWFVTIDESGERAVLRDLVDRRPHAANKGFTQDAWTYDVVDEKTWMRMSGGGLPIPPKNIELAEK